MSLYKSYLLTYNLLNTLLWLRILLTLLTLFISTIPESTPTSTTIYKTLEPWIRWTQTLSVLEILHAATGLTRSPIFTTFTQIFARSVQVWAINYAFSEVTATSPAYGAMVLAWAVADVVRYGYFVGLLGGLDSLTRGLRWLRYSLFIILYPIGIGSEWWLMFRAAGATDAVAVRGVFWFCLGLYGPGSVMMYSYMLKQRRKTLAK
ncbi:tyrosine phosphatase-like protein [Aspergillus spectabilis]